MDISYFEGNHDLYLKKFWEGKLGVTVYDKPHYFEIAGKVIRVEHGDLIDHEDRGYRFLRWFLRTPPIKWTGQNLPGVVVAKIGLRASQMSRIYTSESKTISEEEAKSKTRFYAKKAYDHRPFDYIITGHTHVKDEYQFQQGGREIQSVNLGSWFSQPTVFEISSEGGRWIDLD